MDGQTAAALFHGAEGYNCCQAVLKAFGATDAAVAAGKACGGGRGPGGLCGALLAAKQLAPGRAGELDRRFREAAGSLICREIKAAGRPSCRDCVRIAADLLAGPAV